MCRLCLRRRRLRRTTVPWPPPFPRPLLRRLPPSTLPSPVCCVHCLLCASSCQFVVEALSCFFLPDCACSRAGPCAPSWRPIWCFRRRRQHRADSLGVWRLQCCARWCVCENVARVVWSGVFSAGQGLRRTALICQSAFMCRCKFPHSLSCLCPQPLRPLLSLGVCMGPLLALALPPRPPLCMVSSAPHLLVGG